MVGVICRISVEIFEEIQSRATMRIMIGCETSFAEPAREDFPVGYPVFVVGHKSEIECPVPCAKYRKRIRKSAEVDMDRLTGR